jgi:ABC-type uncharacterized transport system substrate-binding protein
MGSIMPAQAHPHMWIDLRSQIVMQGDNQVSAIYQEWLFDDFFSTALIEEASRNPDGVDAGINAEVQRIMDNLQEYGYFTLVSADDQNVSLGKVDSFEAELRDKRIWISFTVPVSDRINMQTQTFSYAIFDPTYYIEMYHFENETVAFLGDAPKGCKANIIPPNPSNEAIALSRSSSLDAKPDSSIGRLFAETVIVNCQ